MKLSEAWPEIKLYILASRRARIPNYSEDELGFVGGGRDEVVKIERLLGKRIPKEFAYYVEKIAPRNNHDFEALSTAFGPSFELYSSKNLSLDIYSEWRESEKPHLTEPFLIGDDGECAVMLELGHPACPAYLVEELGTDLLAHSLADFLRLLSYRDLVYTTAEVETDDGNIGSDEHGPKWDEAANRIKDKVLEIAPDCIEAWR